MYSLSSIMLAVAGAVSPTQQSTAAAFASGLRYNNVQLRSLTMKLNVFPGSVPITEADKETCERQTGQVAPGNALMGMPSFCRCKHGYPQAFSLDPTPPTQQFKRRSIDRVNSGLLKLTCPLIVNAIDVLEDEGFMYEINSKLETEEELSKCMQNAHDIHSTTRKKLIFGTSMRITDIPMHKNETFQLIKSKIGDKGAEHFIGAGVAGANPLSKKRDVKCLHAWLADYLFRITADDDHDEGMTTNHPIGEEILKRLSERGIDLTGTDSCHQVCSGKNDCKCDDGTVTVPVPRNKQRKKKDKEIGRRKRRQHRIRNETL